MKKEQLFNRKTATLALLLVLAFTFVPSLRAQEYTRCIDAILSYGSTIRDYKADTSIVYSVDDSFNGFLRVTESGSAVALLKITEESFVNDFEIYNDTVYFCGSSYDALNMRFIGFTGYFGLSAFPTTAIRAYYLPEFDNLYRMELLHSAYGGPMHIAMVGKREDGFPTIVDAIVTTPSSWDFYYSTGDNRSKVYDDVAVISNYIVVAARETTDKTGEIYYFSHPAPGFSFLYGISPKISMDTNILSNIILEAREENKFSSVCNVQDGVLGQVIDVIDYSGTSTSHDHVIINASTHTLRDLKYNPDKQQRDVLTNTTYSGYAYSEIFHVNSSGCAGGHQYEKQSIRSIDYQYTDPGHFIASGYRDDKKSFTVYKYMLDTIMGCPQKMAPQCLTKRKVDELDINNLSVRRLDGMLSHVRQTSDSASLRIICWHDPRQQNNQ